MTPDSNPYSDLPLDLVWQARAIHEHLGIPLLMLAPWVGLALTPPDPRPVVWCSCVRDMLERMRD